MNVIIVPMEPTEAALRFSIETLRGQIDILFALGNAPQAPAFIQRLGAQAQYLYELIEMTEESTTKSVQDFSEWVSKESTDARNGIVGLSKQVDDPKLKYVAGVVSDTHFEAIKSLGKEETEATDKIHRVLAPLKAETQKLIDEISRLRTR